MKKKNRMMRSKKRRDRESVSDLVYVSYLPLRGRFPRDPSGQRDVQIFLAAREKFGGKNQKTSWSISY